MAERHIPNPFDEPFSAQDKKKREPLPIEGYEAPEEEAPQAEGELEPILIEEEEREEESEPEPISLVEMDEQGASAVRTIHTTLDDGKKAQFERALNINGQGATRCRLFHCKISEGPLEHLQNTINEWLDNEEIEVKHVSQVIGMLEGKRSEPNLIIMVWF